MPLRILFGAGLFTAIGAAAWFGRDAAGRHAAPVALVVDSALSREESLVRFRRNLRETVRLDSVAGSREELVLRFVRAVERRDSVELGRLLIDRAEFAWLFYPTSPQGLPPYELAPDLLWDLLSRQTERGIGYVLRRHGGRPLGYAGHDCAAGNREGENVIWGPCIIRRGDGNAEVAVRLTGPIMERGGRFKFVSYTNDED